MPVKNNTITITDEIREILAQINEQRRLEYNATKAAKDSFKEFCDGTGTSEVVIGDIADVRSARDKIMDLGVSLAGEISKQYRPEKSIKFGKRHEYGVKEFDCELTA